MADSRWARSLGLTGVELPTAAARRVVAEILGDVVELAVGQHGRGEVMGPAQPPTSATPALANLPSVTKGVDEVAELDRANRRAILNTCWPGER